jgi:23S rRNA (cytidine1920-2'-O)/16S rRNA (cytidine1409-2'-O)-methyltransferase
VSRGLAATRSRAQALILAGQVVIDERRGDKPGALVLEDAQVRLKAGAADRFVSRGGLKLEAALDRFEVSVEGLVCADLGASTGGFTDCLLQRGALRVHACDVGYGQLDPRLAKDPRVTVHDRLNVRHASVADLGEAVDICTADLAFISLRLVLPAIAGLLKPGGVLVALVKPQFEVGPEGISKGGVVRDESVRRRAIEDVIAQATGQRFELVGWMDSPIRGPAGNLEALAVFRLGLRPQAPTTATSSRLDSRA